MYYVQKDYLGSYYSITDERGKIVLLHDREEQVFSFDPWGRRRHPQRWTYYTYPTTYLFVRGFTGHEHLDNFDLINMNGRVYDSWLGRFLSPDPFVQAPTYSQNYNRYSYALNNPLKYIDPSGYHYEEYIEGTNPLGGTKNGSNYNYGIDGFMQHQSFSNTYRMGFAQSLSTNLNVVISNLMSSTYGGAWSRTGGYTFFRSNEQALDYGIGYVNYHNGWKLTLSGSASATRKAYYDNKRKTINHLNHFIACLSAELKMASTTGMDYYGQNDGENDLPDWNDITEAQKIEIMLNAAKENGYIINLYELFDNISFRGAKGILNTSFDYGGLKTRRPVLVTLGGHEYKVWFSLGIPVDMYGNINNPIINLGIDYTVSYNYDLKYGPGQPFPGSSPFFRMVIYGSQKEADLFYKWYME